MFKLTVIDNKATANSFVKQSPSRLLLILDLVEIYGEDVIAKAFEDLIKGSSYELWLSKAHQIKIRILLL